MLVRPGVNLLYADGGHGGHFAAGAAPSGVLAGFPAQTQARREIGLSELLSEVVTKDEIDDEIDGEAGVVHDLKYKECSKK